MEIKHDLHVELVSVDALRPATYNPRKWSTKQIADLKESICRFGMVDPIICNGYKQRRGIVIGGHFRLKVAKDMGYKNVPVCYIDIPTEAAERELNLRLNANTGSFDLDLLKSFDLNMLLDVGFDSKSLAPIWNDLIGAESDEYDETKELKALKKPTVKTGEKYAIGPHSLICGDSTDPKTIELLMGKERANLVSNDLPFNIQLNYRLGLGGRKNYGGEVDDNKSELEYRDFVTKMVKNSVDFCKPDAHILFWCDENYVWLNQVVFKELGVKPQRLCLWLKNSLNPTPGVAFNKAAEFAVYGVVGSPYIAPVNNLTEVMNKEIGTGNSGADTIQDMINVWSVKRLKTNTYDHPTEKPPTLHEKYIRRCSRPGDIVADICCGSASFGVCAHQLGRRAYLCEKDPIFASLALKRMELATGQVARKVGKDGK